MVIYQRFGYIKCPKCDYVSAEESDLSNFQFARTWRKCPKCKTEIETRLIGREIK